MQARFTCNWHNVTIAVVDTLSQARGALPSGLARGGFLQQPVPETLRLGRQQGFIAIDQMVGLGAFNLKAG